MKIKKLLLFILIITGLNHVCAQEWSYFKDFPVNVVPVDVDVNNAGTVFMLTRDARIFYRQINGNWTEMPMPQVPINTKCISVVKGSNKIYYGDTTSGGIYYTSNFGVTWGTTYLETNPVSGFHESYENLSNITNPNLFYALSFDGYGTSITKFTNNGQTGQVYFYVPEYELDKSATELWYTANGKLLIGTLKGIWITENNGGSFQWTNLTENRIDRFAESEEGVVYALGYNAALNQNFLVYSSDYINWTPMDLPNTDEKYTTMYFDNAGGVLWLGSETAMHRTTIGDIAWLDTSYNTENQPIIEIIGHSNKIYNFSVKSIAQQLNAEGNNWAAINNGLMGSIDNAEFGFQDRLFGVSIFGSNNIFTTSAAAEVWINNDLGGVTAGVRSLYTTPDGKVYGDIAYKIKKSLDNGVTYTDITPPGIAGSNYVSFFYVGEAGDLFVKPNESITVWSQDDGLTWSPFIELPLPWSKNITQDSNSVIFVYLPGDFETNSSIKYTQNNGATWNTLDLGDSIFSEVQLFSKGNFTYYITDSGIYKIDITNTENPFTAINLPWNQATDPVTLTGFRISNTGKFAIHAYDLYESVNGGATWVNLGHPDEMPEMGFANDVFFDSNDNTYVLINNTDTLMQRGIYTVDNTMGTNKPGIENPISVYPNPSQNRLTIQTNETIKELMIFDITGKKIRGADISIDNSIDISSLTEGLYLLKVTTINDRNLSVKFIKN